MLPIQLALLIMPVVPITRREMLNRIIMELPEWEVQAMAAMAGMGWWLLMQHQIAPEAL